MQTDSKNKYNIIISGDSISKGIIYDEEKGKYTILNENYVTILQNKVKGVIYNISKFGCTLAKGVSKLKNEFIKHSPDLVLIEYGGNDCDFNWDEIAQNPEKEHKPRTDLNTFEKLLYETINLLTSNKVIPVLMTLPPLNAELYLKWVSKDNPLNEKNILKWLGSVTKIYWWQERYNSVILKIAQETQTKWIDIRGAFLQKPDYSEFLCKDGIHPNKKGHLLIADKITEYAKSNYSELLLGNV